MDRQLEYDKGPAVDEQEDEVGSGDASSGGDDPGRDGLALVGSVVRSSKVGLGFGVGSFVAVYAICYQLVGAMFSAGLFAGGDQEPSRWVVTGLTVLGSQGATIMNGEEPI
ncbi:hypothetical protein [Halostagnicola sp. A-GB9-2]|uniref:hypothetical protein n=1 Tax=Halostagnicola sp. A-GB9-2 TaxID=3048066 RepID=UPI0024BF9388|nr:hypothetical protein [Halostagnicola sp. A-GB9-2]MDJ1432640.1 hypothetical protein [Halostagnicola sp. A-GB9-2]